MQIPILNGVYTDEAADFRASYPRNMIPVLGPNGISAGYFRPADGIVSHGTGPGVDRGAINWNGACYRVMGTKLVSIGIDGTVTEIGDVGTGGQVTMDYSFDYLGINSGSDLYFYNGTTLSKNTDADLGIVNSMLWVDGYFMTTDGEFLVVTELGNPFAVNPLKYGSSEVDPDPIKCLLKVRNEVYALNRHTGEVFDNIGGELFPFQRIEGAQLQRGTLGAHTACVFIESVAFLGSGRNEAPAVWIGANSQTVKISTREVDKIFLDYTEAQLENVVLEARVDKGHQFLYIHLHDQTLVYDASASSVMQERVWFSLTSSITGNSVYRGRNFVWCYDKWLCGDPTSYLIGYLTDSISSHYGDINGWEFGTTIIYNNSVGAMFHQLELVGLTGRIALGTDPTISTSYSVDGESWSQERFIKAGKTGDRLKRLVWFQQGAMRNWRIQRFRGTSDAHISVARLEATLEPLSA